jgi:cell wall-associated NlpC family hydrolase
MRIGRVEGNDSAAMSGPYRPGPVLERVARSLLPSAAIVRRPTALRGRTATRVSRPRLTCLVVVASLLVALAVQSGGAGADTVGTARANVAALLAQLNAANLRESQLTEAYDQARIHLQQVDANLAGAKSQLGQTGSQLVGAQARVREMAIQSYMDGGVAGQLSLLIPDSAKEIAVRGTYVAAATGSTNDAIDALRAARIELGQKQTSLATAEAQATQAVAQMADAQKAAAAAATQTEAAYNRALVILGRTELAAAQAQQAAANRARIDAQLAAARQAQAQAQATAGAPLIAAGGGTTGIGNGSSEFGGSGSSVGGSSSPPPPSPGAQSAIYYAEQQLGKPYEWGGGGPGSYDCSGLTAWAWGHAGHALAHSSEEQYYDTTHVSVAQLEPGDLVFYGDPPHHVGLYVGNGEMINALHSGTNVEYDSIYIESDLIGGGRVN